jgi:hypothetical protein
MRMNRVSGRGALCALVAAAVACTEDARPTRPLPKPDAATDDAGAPASDSSTAPTPSDAAVDQDAAADAGANEDAGQPGGCIDKSLDSIAGKYSDASGEEHWLRVTAKAQLYAVVPSGPAIPDALPVLLQIVEACADQRRFVATTRDEQHLRADWLKTADGLALCTTAAGSDAVETLLANAPPDASDLVSGCYGEAWVLLTSAVTP